MTARDRTTILKVGDIAPDFTLPTHNEGELNLAWYRDRKNVLLAFYPGDWTPVCTAQIPGYENDLSKFDARDCQVLAVSVDSVACHRAWARSLGGLNFPLMSDFYPHGAVAQMYGVLHQRGYAERTTFLIDKAGVIRHIERFEKDVLPVNQELFTFLAHLNKKPV